MGLYSSNRMMKMLIALSLLFSFSAAYAAGTEGHTLEKVEGQHDQDFRVFTVHKPVIMGIAALRLMTSQTDLNLWLAGNQFFAMEKVIQQFQEKYPTVKSVGVITLPPGKEADAILKGGWGYQGEKFSFEPDLYATVDMKPLQDFKTKGLAKTYFTYMHNELTLMVRKGNPKAIKGIDDLKRKDLRIYLPNPLDEGIMSVYGRKVLTQHNLWDALVGSKGCKGCQVGNVYFTEVHYREIPKAVNEDKADSAAT